MCAAETDAREGACGQSSLSCQCLIAAALTVCTMRDAVSSAAQVPSACAAAVSCIESCFALHGTMMYKSTPHAPRDCSQQEGLQGYQLFRTVQPGLTLTSLFLPGT